MREPDLYQLHWSQFKDYCDKRAKDADCLINNKGWQKLREYHLESYVKEIPNPYGFLFNIKYIHTKLYRSIKCMPKFYHRYRRLREKEYYDTVGKGYVRFPTWKGWLKDDETST